MLVVDDERPARQKIRRFLSQDSRIATVFEAADGVRALDLIRTEDPDVVFLDIEMPGVDGFGVVEALAPEARPQIVFVTAFDQYAVRAFDAQAVDYVLKPFDAERLTRALGRARERIGAEDGRQRLDEVVAAVRKARPTPLERLLVEQVDRALLLPVARVDRFEAERNYVIVHVGAERYRLRATLDGVEARLDPAGFVRVSRSTIVNLERVKELRPWGGGHGDYVVVLHGGAEVRLSRRYRDRLSRFAP